jgi:uncharacterized metal-binding protein YceD (DUF177 family)
VTAPEFSRTRRVDTLGTEPTSLSIEADEGERTRLARRFGLKSIGRLSAGLTLLRNGEIVTATGRVTADVIQSCVATDEPVTARIDEPLLVRFVPDAALAGSGANEVELSDPDCDTVGYDGAMIDVGEAVAESMALALDPFPRSPGAEAVLREAGVISEAEASAQSGPFSGLAALKDKLEKG